MTMTRSAHVPPRGTAFLQLGRVNVVPLRNGWPGHVPRPACMADVIWTTRWTSKDSAIELHSDEHITWKHITWKWMANPVRKGQ